LERVPGVSRVVPRETRAARLQFEVESLSGKAIRADLARTVVSNGWNLTELRPVAMSLEEVFLQLTNASPDAVAQEAEVVQ
jgi:hypothetical protein